MPAPTCVLLKAPSKEKEDKVGEEEGTTGRELMHRYVAADLQKLVCVVPYVPRRPSRGKEVPRMKVMPAKTRRRRRRWRPLPEDKNSADLLARRMHGH